MKLQLELATELESLESPLAAPVLKVRKPVWHCSLLMITHECKFGALTSIFGERVLELCLSFSYRNITHKLAINFQGECHPLDRGNEGILLVAQMDNAEVFPIGFYRSTDEVEPDQCPTVVNEANGILKLTYSNQTVLEVSGTLQNQSSNSFVAYSFETDRLLQNHVRFNFSQLFVSNDADCDVWALDSVRVAVEHGGCSRVLLDNDFDKSPM